MKSKSHLTHIVSAFLFTLTAFSAHAQVAPSSSSVQSPAAPTAVATADSDHFTLRLGAFFLSSINTKLSLSDSAGHGGQEIDFKKDLSGQDSLSLFRADAEWRFTSRQKAQFTYFDINQTASHALTGSINWGDQTYPVNAVVNARFETIIYKLNYGYTFYRNETDTQELTGLIGFHITELTASLSAGNSGLAEGASVTAPLPVVGLEWKARLSDHLTSHVSYEYFGVSIDNKYTGNLSDFQALLEYQFTRNWSLGAGYNRYTSRATASSSGALTGDKVKLIVRHSYNGLMLFVTTSF